MHERTKLFDAEWGVHTVTPTTPLWKRSHLQRGLESMFWVAVMDTAESLGRRLGSTPPQIWTGTICIKNIYINSTLTWHSPGPVMVRDWVFGSYFIYFFSFSVCEAEAHLNKNAQTSVWRQKLQRWTSANISVQWNASFPLLKHIFNKRPELHVLSVPDEAQCGFQLKA